MPELPPEQRAAISHEYLGDKYPEALEYVRELEALLSTREEELRRLREALAQIADGQPSLHCQNIAIAALEVGQVEHGPPAKEEGGDR